jgi:glutamyl-tRNA reductase
MCCIFALQKTSYTLNNFRLITITHKTANINHIGRYIPSFNDDPGKLAEVLRSIKQQLGIEELLYLATCNRLTFLFVRETPVDNAFLVKLFGMLHEDIPQHCLHGIADVTAIYNGEDCIQHIFEVASSLDSLVVGEREILRQLRTAYEFCDQNQLTGDNIRLVMKSAIPTAKEIYTRTKIGENSVSVVSLAMQQMMQNDISPDARFLIIGAGQTNHLVAKFLLKHGFKNFTVFNRSLENAQVLADKLKGTAHALADLQTYTQPFEVLITCTGATEPIITQQLYSQLIGNDTSQKIVIDLSVPTNVSPAVVRNFAIQYIEVERLRSLAAENLALRKQEVDSALLIIDDRLTEFKLLHRQRRVERGMSEIPTRMREVKERALTSVFQKEIALLDENAQQTLEKVIAYLEKKYIGIPISVAKNVLEAELIYQAIH